MDNFEETLSEELDNGEWKSSPTANEDIEMLKKTAKATPKKSERINLRIGVCQHSCRTSYATCSTV